jgi:MoxR-like ATPase
MATATDSTLFDADSFGLDDNTKPKGKRGTTFLHHQARLVAYALGSGRPALSHVIGPAGAGKTATFKALAGDLWDLLKQAKVDNYDELLAKFGDKKVVAIHLPAPQLRLDQDIIMPFPVKDGDGLQVDYRMRADISDPDTLKILVLDEVFRADKSWKQALLELPQGSLFGIKIPGLIFVALLDNPAGDDYQVTATLDPAQGSRWRRFTIEDSDLGWKGWFEQRWPHLDFGPLWSFRNSLDKSQRKGLAPRTMEHMVLLGEAGFPVEAALGITSKRRRIVDANGNDTTTAVMAGFSQALGFDPRPLDPHDKATARNMVMWAMVEGHNHRLVGPHGVGKTEWAKAIRASDVFQEMFRTRWGTGLEGEYISATSSAGNDLSMIAPGDDGTIRPLIPTRFRRRDGLMYGLTVDERARASRRMGAALMAIEQERSIAGVELSGLHYVQALDNPVEYKGLRYQTRPLDEAQADRYVFTLEVLPSTLPWDEFLVDNYGNIGRAAIDWWSEDLDDFGKATSPARVLESFCQNFQMGLPLACTTPVVGDKLVELPLVLLERRFSAKEVVSFEKLITNAEEFLERIADGDEEAAEFASSRLTAVHADRLFENAELLGRYARALPKDLRRTLLSTSDSERIAFWSAVLQGKTPQRS